MDSEKGNSGYDYIWDGVISNVIKFCVDDLDKKFADEVCIDLFNLIKYRRELREIYHKKRDWLKIEYLPNKRHPILDFHKMSAIICRCIIGLKPISYNEKIAQSFFIRIQNDKNIAPADKLQWQIKNFYINYRIAFLVAEGIVYDDLLCWIQKKILFLEEQGRPLESSEQLRLRIYYDFREKLKSMSTLSKYYQSQGKNRTHDDFESSMIICLMKNDILKRDFDYLSFSANMFQWQEYTRRNLFVEILSNYSTECEYNINNIEELYYLDEN